MHLKAFTQIKTSDEMKLHKLNIAWCVDRKERWQTIYD